MATTIKLKNSVTTTNAPSSLAQGEVAINITDKKVWVGNAATTPVQLLGDGGSASFTSIAFGAGTVSNPSITFTGDTNTGIYSPAADTIAFTEGGAESMRINSAGDVGIGTNSPNARLTIQDATSGDGTVRFGSNTTFYGEAKLIYSTGEFRFGAFGAGMFPTFYSAGAEAVRILPSGNFGIGTTNPTARLTIQDATSGDGTARFGSNTTFYGEAKLIFSTGEFRFGAFGSGMFTTFYSAGSERMRIDSSGNVGIGTSSPSFGLVVQKDNGSGYVAGFRSAAGSPMLTIQNTGGISQIQGLNSALSATADIALQVSGGNVGIGTSSPAARLDVRTSGSASNLYVISDISTSALASRIALGNSAGTVRMTIGLLGGGGEVAYLGTEGTFPMYFQTNGTERMRITSGGSLFVGTTSASWNSSEKVSSASSTANAPAFAGFVSAGAGTYVYTSWNNAASGTRQHMVFADGAGGGTRGTITTDGANTAYNTSSDYRLKENVVPLTGALSRVIALKPSKWKWIENQEDGEGFVAHELAQVIPQAVTGQKDAVDEEGKPIYQGVDTSFLVATLTAAIQELKAELDSVKTELNQLKGA